MLDINLIRSNPETVKAALKKRGFEADFSEFLALDVKRREILTEVENLKARKNKVSAEVPSFKKEGKDTSEIFAEMKEIGEKVTKLDSELETVENQMNEFLYSLPNMPDQDLKEGGKENNETIYVFGKKPEFSFQPKNHIELCESLGLIDYERGAKISGSGSWIYTGMGARLEWALLNFL